jgi:hypothetical protein
VISTIVAEFTKVETEFQTKAKAALQGAFKEFFKENPAITSIEWVQYTPHFNDGDTCYFGVHDMYAMVGEIVEDEEDYYAEERSNSISTYSELKGYERESKNFSKFAKQIGKLPDSIFETTFGDHAKVVATPKGFEVDEYDHD